MAKDRNYVFVLWADQFEEIVTVIFVAELRTAGLKAQVVGLTTRQAKGRYGLVLIPDLSLGQALALAPGASYIVIPCTLAGLKRLKNEPRVRQLFQQAHAKGVKFIIGQSAYGDGINLELFPTGANIMVYPENEKLVEFIRKLIENYWEQ